MCHAFSPILTTVSNGTISANMVAIVAARASQASCSGTSADSARAVVVGSIVEVSMLVVFAACVRVITVADVTEATSSTSTDVLGHTLKLVVALLTTTENTTLGLELIHGHGGQSGCLVVSGSVVMNLVDGNSGVDNIGLDRLLLDDWLNGLVDVLLRCQ